MKVIEPRIACRTIRKSIPQSMFSGTALSVFLTAVCVPVASANPPTTPENFRYEVYANRAAELFWDRSSDDSIVLGYEITQNGVSIGVFDALSYFTNTLTPGDIYTYSIAAVDNEDNRSGLSSVTFVAGEDEESGIATPITPTTPTTPTTPITPTPPVVPPTGTAGVMAPANVSSDVYAANSFEIFWDRFEGEFRQYEIFLDGTSEDITDGTSHYFGNVASGQSYSVDIIAIASDGGRSAPVNVVVNLADGSSSSEGGGSAVEPITGAPPAPENAFLAVYSSTAAEIFWERPAAGFGVVTTSVFRDGLLVDETTGVSYFDDSREPGVDYQYELIAANANGSDGSTVIGEATVTLPPPDVVEPPVVEPPVVEPPVVEPPVVEPPVVEPPVVVPPVAGTSVFVPDPTDIGDADAFYEADGYDTVNVIRVDIRTETTAGTCEIDDQSGCTLADVIADVDGNDDFKVEIPIHFKTDDFADDGSTSNATLRQRGATARLGDQKSFRIKLDSKDVLWRNERRLQLNKHPFERTRQRNKLSFDLMQELPFLPSLRTQFVNLWIDDGAGPEDYGLFTHVEFAGKEYLVNRGADKDDRVYKTEFFQFSESDLRNVQVDEDGEPIDEDRFEQSLQIERGDDHSNLVAMLTALNDPNQSFGSVFDRYFNHNNVLMWVTANILMRQLDAITHNFYLYNPIGTEKFYFLPWDYDGTFQPARILEDSYEDDELRRRLFFGYAHGINSNFVSNYYRLPGIHQKIVAAADEIRNTWMTDANITAKAIENDALVGPFLERSPDGDFNSHNNNIPLDFANYVASIHEQLSVGFDIPMPPTLEDVVVSADTVTFSWTPAYDVTETNTLDYDLEVATSTDFTPDSIVLTVEDIPDAADLVVYEADISQFPSGSLVYRITARGDSDPLRVWQVAKNRLKTDGPTFFGMGGFEIP